jgi:hypothetical protein
MKRFIFVVVLSLVVSHQAHAAMLTFQPASGTFGNDVSLPAGYGNRVTATSQDGFSYGLGGGPTPNVVVNYGPEIATWSGGFGDLPTVVYAEGDTTSSVFRMNLVADPGYLVRLNSFDMAGWPNRDETINSV